MSGDPPGWNADAEDDALAVFFDPFHEMFGPMAGELYRAGEAAGYKRGYAAALADINRAVSGLLVDHPTVRMIEGPKTDAGIPVSEQKQPVAPRPAPHSEAGNVNGSAKATSGEMQATVPKSPPATSAAPRWTEERRAKLCEAYPTFPIVADVLDALNRLPGERITMTQMRDMASNRLKLRRAPTDLPPVFTEERDAMILRLYPTETPREMILEAVNALPGQPTTLAAMTTRAINRLGLHRPVGQRWAAKETQRDPRTSDLIEAARKIAQDSAGPSAADPPVEPPPAPPPAAAEPPAQPPSEAVERVPMPLVDAMAPIPPHPLAVTLSPPGPDGKVAAPMKTIQQWCMLKGFGKFDGTQIERLNKFRAGRNEPPIVVSWL